MDTSLIAAPYEPPAVRVGDWLDDERYGLAQVGGWTTAPISWPFRKKTGRPSLILCGDLVRAVRTESVYAICHWFGVRPTTVWAWRQALDVSTTDGSLRIARRGFSPEATARGLARAAEPDALARMASTQRGKPAAPGTRAALLRAAQAPRPPGWGKRANEWMIEGTIAARLARLANMTPDERAASEGNQEKQRQYQQAAKSRQKKQLRSLLATTDELMKKGNK